MSAAQKRTISLPAEHSAYIDAQIASGAYATASEVVRAGLRALEERDAAVQRWLERDVAAAYDALKSDPTRAINAKAAFADIRRRKGL